MAKYNSERDFIQQELMGSFDPTMFVLKEDKDNYYIAWVKQLEDGKTETKNIFTIYKDKIQELMKVYEEE